MRPAASHCRCSAGRLSLLCGLMVGLVAAPLSAGSLEIQSQHDPWPEAIEGLGGWLWLKPAQMMVLEAQGPGSLGIQTRGVVAAGRQAGPVDLTVVRDDLEQGTVRFRFPQAEPGTSEGSWLTPEVRVQIDVPVGRHRYRILVSTVDRGLVVRPATGQASAGAPTVLATPGLIPAAGPEAEGSPVRRPKAVWRPKVFPDSEPLLLDPVLLAQSGGEGKVESWVLRYDPNPEQPPFSPAVAISGSLAGMLLAGGLALAVSGGVQQARAEDEPVQIPAGALVERTERAYTGSGVLFGLGAAAAVTAIVLYWTDGRAGAPEAGGKSLAVLNW